MAHEISVVSFMFRTEFDIPENRTLKLTDRILTMGSCFADVIGNYLETSKFRVSVNPFGVNYNPWSIHKQLRYIIYNSVLSPETFINRDDVTLNYDFHSSNAAMSQAELESTLREKIGACHYLLKDCKWLLITYGTAFVYERNDNGEIVANCHKVPAANFQKHLLSQKKILEDFHELHNALISFNPDIQVILTLSPVRHLKDTIPLNAVSKSILRLACHTLQETYDNVHYFPAYELLLDDLRDYRFYKADMIHPNDVGEEYIWARFMDCYFDDAARKFVKEWKEIRAAINHRPFQPGSASHQKFLVETLSKLNRLNDIVDVKEEIAQLESQLVKS